MAPLLEMLQQGLGDSWNSLASPGGNCPGGTSLHSHREKAANPWNISLQSTCLFLGCKVWWRGPVTLCLAFSTMEPCFIRGAVVSAPPKEGGGILLSLGTKNHRSKAQVTLVTTLLFVVNRTVDSRSPFRMYALSTPCTHGQETAAPGQ